MADTVSDFMLKRLSAWGVKRIFGFPGDGINGIMGALERAGDRFDFVQARHEEMAAFMACGHAKYTGQVGVCLATSGPGAIHLLNGLYDAKKDHQPVVAIIGQQKLMSLGGDFQQEVDLPNLFKDVAREYVHQVDTPVQMRTLVDRAFRIAIAERAVTCIIVPADIQEMEAEILPPREHGEVVTGVGYSRPRMVPEMTDLERAAAILNAGNKVAILVGAGALDATDEVLAVQDLLGAGIAKALLGKAVVPDDLPFVTGNIGMLGTKPSYDMMTDCDTLFMIGSGFPYSEFLPKPGAARGVQIDIDAKMLSLRYPMDVNLQGDSRETLRALIPLLKRKTDRSWQQKLEEKTRHWWTILESRAMADANPVNPQRAFWELSKRLPDNAILAVDTGTSTDWYARDVKLRRGMMGTASGGLATMGPGMPYAIAAKFAYPDRYVIGLIGDGAMQMNGINALVTVAHYWKRWGNAKFVIQILNNRDLNQVTWEQRELGMPRYVPSQALPDFPFARYAELLGLRGIFVNDPSKLGTAWDEALASDRPCVIEVYTDPSVPPLPPHISFKDARHFMKALLSGDPNSRQVIMDTFRQELSDYIHHKEPEHEGK
jgi:pyruvate dehydrogenase (quinone)